MPSTLPSPLAFACTGAVIQTCSPSSGGWSSMLAQLGGEQRPGARRDLRLTDELRRCAQSKSWWAAGAAHATRSCPPAPRRCHRRLHSARLDSTTPSRARLRLRSLSSRRRLHACPRAQISTGKVTLLSADSLSSGTSVGSSSIVADSSCFDGGARVPFAGAVVGAGASAAGFLSAAGLASATGLVVRGRRRGASVLRAGAVRDDHRQHTAHRQDQHRPRRGHGFSSRDHDFSAGLFRVASHAEADGLALLVRRIAPCVAQLRHVRRSPVRATNDVTRRLVGAKRISDWRPNRRTRGSRSLTHSDTLPPMSCRPSGVGIELADRRDDGILVRVALDVRFEHSLVSAPAILPTFATTGSASPHGNRRILPCARHTGRRIPIPLRWAGGSPRLQASSVRTCRRPAHTRAASLRAPTASCSTRLHRSTSPAPRAARRDRTSACR